MLKAICTITSTVIEEKIFELKPEYDLDDHSLDVDYYFTGLF